MSTHPIIQIILFFSTLLSGSINTVSKKIQYQSCAPGLDECPANVIDCDRNVRSHPFNKPWIQTGVMFLAEMLCLPFYYFGKCCSSKDEVTTEKNESRKTYLKNYFKLKGIFLILATLDLVGSVLASIGLMWITSSVYQLFRGSIVIFTGIWTVLFLKRKLKWESWAGIGFVVLGLIFVGISGFLNSNNNTKGNSTNFSNTGLFIFGIATVIVGQFANSFQMVLEEKFLKDANVSPLYMIGWEGIFGLILTCGIAFPIVTNIPGSDCNKYENIRDGFVMMGQSWFILFWNFISLLSLCFFNGLGLTVSKYLSSVHRTLIDACRTIVVWVSMIIVCYTAGSHWGEPWDVFSYFEVIGFIFLCIGTLTYNGILSLERILNFFRKRPFNDLNDQPSINLQSNSEELKEDDNGKGDERKIESLHVGHHGLISSYHAPNTDNDNNNYDNNNNNYKDNDMYGFNQNNNNGGDSRDVYEKS